MANTYDKNNHPVGSSNQIGGNKDADNYITVKYTHYGEYRYFGNFLVSFGQRAEPTNNKDCSVSRIWANNELIYDRNLGWYKPGLRFKFYPGTEDQDEVHNGFHYRGLMCIMFTNFPLADYGDSYPAIRAEIYDSVDFINEVGVLVGLDYLFRFYQELDVNADRIVRFAQDESGASGVDAYMQSVRLSTKALSTNVAVPSVSFKAGFFYANKTIAAPDKEARVIAFITASNLMLLQENTTDLPITKNIINIGTGERLSVYDRVDDNIAWDYAIGFRNDSGGRIDDYFLGWEAGALTAELVYIRNGKALFATYTDAAGAFPSPLVAVAKGRELPASTELLASFSGSVRRLVFSTGETPTTQLLTLYTPGAGTVYMTYFDPRDDTAIVLVKTSGNTGHAVKVTMAGAVVWTSADFTLPALTDTKWKIAQASSNLLDGTLALKEAAAFKVNIIDLDNGSIVPQVVSNLVVPNDNTPLFWDSQSNTLYNNGCHFMKISTPVEPTLNVGEVLRQFSVRAGYDNSDIVLSGMDDMPLSGYVLSNATDLGSLANGLAQLYGFNWLERAGQILFKYNYDNTGELIIDATVPAGRQAMLTENLDDTTVNSVVISSELSLPNLMSITYFNEKNNYEAGYQQAKRSNFPNRTQDSVGKVGMSLPIVIDDDTALKLIYGALYRVWASKIGYSARLPADFMRVDPSDVIEFTAEGFTYQGQIVQATINADNSTSLTLTEMATGAYPIAIAAQPSVTVPKVPVGSPVNYVIFDLPARSETENRTGQFNLTAFIGGYRENTFAGGQLEIAQADTPNDWTVRLTVDASQEGFIGFIDGEVTVHDDPTVFDDTTVLRIKRGNIPLSKFVGATDAAMIGGANLVVIGKTATPEYISFGVVTAVDADTVELSHLLRGRYGTELFMNVHASGDYFVFMEHEQLVTYPVSGVHQSLFFRALGVAQPAWQADVQMVTPVGNSRKPYAPVNFAITREDNGDINLVWVRRARFFNSPATDYATDVMPLDESVEEYTVEIYDADWNVLLRREIVSGGANYIYMIADQVEDSTNEYEEYNFVIYQNTPSTIEIGFPGGKTLQPTTIVTFAGTIEGGGELTGALGAVFAGVIDGGGELSGELAEAPAVEFAGTIDGGGELSGDLTDGEATDTFAGVIDGEGTLTGQLTVLEPERVIDVESYTTNTGTTSKTLGLVLPDELVEGNLLIAHIAWAHDDTTANPVSATVPDGWRNLKTQSTGKEYSIVYAHIIDGTETDPSFTVIGSNAVTSSVGVLMHVSGTDPKLPIMSVKTWLKQVNGGGTIVGPRAMETELYNAMMLDLSTYIEAISPDFTGSDLVTEYDLVTGTDRHIIGTDYYPETVGNIAAVTVPIAAGNDWNSYTSLALSPIHDIVFPEIVAVTEAANSGSGTTSLAVPLPAEREPGDLLLVRFGMADRTFVGGRFPIASAPDGYREIPVTNMFNGDTRLYYRVADGTETVDPTLETANGGAMVGQLFCIRGADVDNPIDNIVHAINSDFGAGTSVTFPAFTAKYLNSMMLGLWQTYNSISNPTTLDNFAQQDVVNYANATNVSIGYGFYRLNEATMPSGVTLAWQGGSAQYGFTAIVINPKGATLSAEESNRYWRIRRLDTPAATRMAFAELEFNGATPTGGTAAANTNNANVGNLLDGNAATDWISDTVTTSQATVAAFLAANVVYDFGTPVVVTDLTLTASVTDFAYASDAFVLDSSNDGVNWKIDTAFTGAAWSSGEARTFARPDKNNLPGHKAWRIFIETNTGDATYTVVGEMELSKTAGSPMDGSDETGPGNGGAIASTAFWEDFRPCWAFNNTYTTGSNDGAPHRFWATNAGADRFDCYIGYVFTENKVINEVRILADHNIAQMPKTFRVESSDDGLNWKTEWSVADAGTWVLGSWKTFTAPVIVDPDPESLDTGKSQPTVRGTYNANS